MITNNDTVKLSVACVCVIYSYFWYLTVNVFFEPMIVQVRDFLHVTQPVLQVITILSFVCRVVKNDIKVLKIETK